MNIHELELRKYAKNFILINEIESVGEIEYFNFNDIVIITDNNLISIIAKTPKTIGKGKKSLSIEEKKMLKKFKYWN